MFVYVRVLAIDMTCMFVYKLVFTTEWRSNFVYILVLTIEMTWHVCLHSRAIPSLHIQCLMLYTLREASSNQLHVPIDPSAIHKQLFMQVSAMVCEFKK